MSEKRDIAPAEMVNDVRAKLDALAMPCPECGTVLVSARVFSAPTGAYIGLVCTQCQTAYQVAAEARS